MTEQRTMQEEFDDAREYIHFNTGRMYDKHGQVITVLVLRDYKVLMGDHSRGIYTGLYVPYDKPHLFKLKDFVMREYDNYSYCGDSRAAWLSRLALTAREQCSKVKDD